MPRTKLLILDPNYSAPWSDGRHIRVCRPMDCRDRRDVAHTLTLDLRPETRSTAELLAVAKEQLGLLRRCGDVLHLPRDLDAYRVLREWLTEHGHITRDVAERDATDYPWCPVRLSDTIEDSPGEPDFLDLEGLCLAVGRAFGARAQREQREALDLLAAPARDEA